MKITNKDNRYFFSDNISKTNKLSLINIIKKQNKEEIFYFYLITQMLTDTTKTQSKSEFAITKANLYDSKFRMVLEDLHSHIILEYQLDYIDVMYLPEDITAKLSTTFNDFSVNDKFTQLEFELAKETLELSIKMLKNDYTEYATRLTKDKLVNDNLYITLQEQEELLKTVTLEKIQDVWDNKKIVTTYILDKSNNQDKIKLITQGAYNKVTTKTYDVNSEYTFDEKNLEIDQLKLNLVYQFKKNYTKHEKMVFNAILGGDSFSKLFVHVREAHSLCYYVNSRILYKNLIHIKTGINHDNLDLARELIDQQIEAMKNGEVNELEIAKNKLVNTYTQHENKYNLNKTLIEKHLLEQEEKNINKIKELIMQVDKTKIINMANDLEKIKEMVIK